MKLLLLTLLLATSAFSQENSKCKLDLITDEPGQGVTVASDHAGLMELLKDKRYEVSIGKFNEYYNVSSKEPSLETLEKSNNKTFLWFKFFQTVKFINQPIHGKHLR